MKILVPILLLFPFMANAAGKIINADIAPSGTANIARNKLAAGANYAWCVNNSSGFIADTSVSINSAVATDANGAPVASSTSATELGFVHGVTSSIQTQINAISGAATSIGAFGSSPNANGLSLSANVLNMQPADGTHPGGVSITTQTIGGNKTFSGTGTWTVAGALSAPAVSFTGSPIATGGTGTTTKPLFLIEDAATSTNWSLLGTYVGVNGKTGFTGNFLDIQLNAANVYRANYQGGFVFWNTNDNANFLGAPTFCNGTANPSSSANCVSMYQSGGGILNIYSPNAAQGATNMMRFNNSSGAIAIGAASPSTTGQVLVQVNNFAAYNARNSLEVAAKASQTGHLQEWQNSSFTALGFVDVTGKASFANLQDAAISTAGLGRFDSSGNVASSSELSGDVTTSGSNATTVAKIQSTTVSGTTGSGNVVFSSSPTMTNPVVGTQSLGDNSTKAASTAFVQSALAQLNPAAAVSAASTANIPGTYTNAVGGVCVGDTFTVTATGAFTVDGQTPAAGKRVLLKNQSSAFQNGVWDVTVAGSVGVSPVLTRSADWDSSADMNAGSLIPVINGTANANTVWYQTAAVTTCSSDAQVYTQFSGGGGSGGVTTWTVDNAVVVPANGGTVSAQDYRWRCVGRNIQIKGHFTTGTPVATTFTLGLKYAVDSTQISSSSGGTYVGQVYQLQTGTANLVAPGEMAAFFYDGSDTANIYFAYQVNGQAYNKQTGSGFFAASTNQDFYIEYPVVANAPCP